MLLKTIPLQPPQPKSPGGRQTPFSVITHVSPTSELHAKQVDDLCNTYSMAEVICVMVDGRPDQRGRWQTLSERHPHLRILRLEFDFGKGAAMRIGGRAASGSILVFVELGAGAPMSAATAVVRMLQTCQSLDGVVVNRFARHGRVRRTSLRRVLGRLFALWARTLFSLAQKDPQSPVKAFRSQAFDSLFEGLRLYGRGFDVELLHRARELRLKLGELDVEALPEHGDWPLLKTGLSVMAALVWLRVVDSPLSRVVPGLSLLGRRYAIPAKTHYDVLVFCWRDSAHPAAGGSEEYLRAQAEAWARRGHRVVWISQRFPGAPRREDRAGVHYIRLPRFPWVFPFAALWYIFVSDKRFDFIVDCMNGLPFWTPLFSTKPKVCLVHHVHSHHFRAELPRPIASLAQYVETRLAPRVYARTPFVTVSESTRDEMRRLKMTTLDIGIIQNGVSPDLSPGRKAELPTVLYLGRVKRYKRIELLVNAFALIRDTVEGARLVIAGCGDHLEALQEYVARCGPGGIRIVGRVSEEDKRLLMQQAWVFAMPSEIEGWGIAVIEAAACGTPSVAYDVAGLRDCVRDGETGLLAHDDSEFAASLQRLLVDRALRERLAAGAVRWASNFSWEATADETMKLIRNLQPWRAVFEMDQRRKWCLTSGYRRLQLDVGATST